MIIAWRLGYRPRSSISLSWGGFGPV